MIVSSELDEIYALSDRIAVMYEGKIVGFCSPDIPEHELGLLMAGAGGRRAGRATAAGPAPADRRRDPRTASRPPGRSGRAASRGARAVSDIPPTGARPGGRRRRRRAGRGAASPGKTARAAHRRRDHPGDHAGQLGCHHDPGDLPGARGRRRADHLQRSGRDAGLELVLRRSGIRAGADLGRGLLRVLADVRGRDPESDRRSARPSTAARSRRSSTRCRRRAPRPHR